MKTVLFSITLFLFICLTVLQLIAFDTNWYKNKFIEQDIYQQFSEDQIDNQIQNLFQYLNFKENLSSEFYTTKEVLHLKDIKNIFLGIKIIYSISIISLIIFIIYLISIKNFLKSLFINSVISLLIFLVIIVLLITNFNQLFLFFHQASFNNDYWLLNPDVDYLIVLFPPTLFYELAIKILKHSIFINLLIIVISAILIYSKKLTANKFISKV